jgi:flavodoxin I
MKGLVIYDSVFGNTEAVARAIGVGLGLVGEGEAVGVGEAKLEQLSGVKLLVVGSPTRQFRPTPAILEFLKSLSIGGLNGVKVAAFDTRIAKSDIKSPILSFLVNLGGYAAKPIADAMKKKGGNLVLAPEGFFVEDQQGPLKKGELDRAAEWAHTLSGQIMGS